MVVKQNILQNNAFYLTAMRYIYIIDLYANLHISQLYGGGSVSTEYGKYVRAARLAHDPPLSAKEFAKAIGVSGAHVTDIEKGRRLPSLEKQNEISGLLANDTFPKLQFDDLAAASNENMRIVAGDIAVAIRNNADLRQLVRLLSAKKISSEKIKVMIDEIRGGNDVDK